MTKLGAGSRLGPYEILNEVGAGGMGVVYRARDTRLGREVAVKVLAVSLADSVEAVRRFEFEARAAGALDHPNVMTVHDVGSFEGAPYLVCELLAGETLRRRLERGRLPVVKAREYGMQIASALAVAHEKGIVHRDLKPENVFVTADDRIKILDFGIAKLLPPPAVVQTGEGALAPAEIKTQTGALLGTPSYMAPEQIRGRPSDQRSDIFAFGLTLYEMLAGRRAFTGASIYETGYAVLSAEPAEIPGLPAPLARIIHRCLRKEPAERYQSARELELDLKEMALPGGGNTRPALRPGGAIAPPAAPPARVTKNARLFAGMPLVRGPMRTAIAVALLLAIAGGALFALRRRKSSGPSFQQVTFRHGVVWSARFAQDSVSIVYSAAWDGKPVQSHTAVAGRPESRTLNLPAARVLAVSPAGELAVLLEGDSESLDYMRLGTLARVPFAGGSPRELLTHVRAADWDPRSGDLVVVHEVEGKNRVEFPPGNVLYSCDGWISHARISPQGRIAVLEHPYYGETRGTVVLVDPQDKAATPLTPVLGGAMGLAWSPQGDEIWFSGGDTSQSAGVRAVTLDGRQRLVLQTPGSVMLHDVARDGRILVSRETWRNWIRGLPPGAKEERDLSWLDYSVARDLSADGRRLLFFEAGEGGGELFSAFVRVMDGSPPVELGPGYALSLTEDGAWALMGSIKDPSQLVLVPTGPGQSRAIQLAVAAIAEARWFPGGKAILVTAREKATGQLRLFIADAESGRLRPITEPGLPGQEVVLRPVSPDGKRVLARRHEGYFVYPVDGGQPSPVQGLRNGQIPIGWHESGRSLLIREPGLPAKVSRLDLADWTQRAWRQFMPRDPGGVSDVPWIYFGSGVASDAYVYSYHQILSDLYVVRGMN
jgi:hypothetical protein